MAPWFNSTQELSGSHAHTILIQNYVIGFHLNFPQSLPIGPMVYVFLAQHSSSCNQFSPIMWPCTWWALAHTSWMKMLREILLCTIPVLPLSHCLQISVKIKKKKKSTNAIIPLFSLPTVILNAAERSIMCSRASIKACRKPGEL